MEKILLPLLLACTLFIHTSHTSSPYINARYDQLDCIEDSSQPECKSYQYPLGNATADVNSLCGAMDFMPGCSIKKQCDSSSNNNDSPKCHPMSILDDICHLDTMSGMKGCRRSYNSLCNVATTQVDQCKVYSNLLSTIPSTSDVKTWIRGICNSHTMEACEMCPQLMGGGPLRGCDLLGMYAKLCQPMPDMEECQRWSEMCSSGQFAEFPEICPGKGGDHLLPPIMRMYFHTGYEDYILFKGWVPRSAVTYWMSVLAVVVLGIFYEYFITLRARLEYKWSLMYRRGGFNGSCISAPPQYSPPVNNQNRSGGGVSECEVNTAGQSPTSRLLLANSACQQRQGGVVEEEDEYQYMMAEKRLGDYLYFLPQLQKQQQQPAAAEAESSMLRGGNSQEIVRALMQFIETVIGYALMLIAMTFNVGLFLAVPFGLAIGTFLFGKYRDCLPRHACCS